MRTILFFLLILASTAISAQQKTIFVIIDGVAYDVIQKLHLPNLNHIAGKNGMAPTLVGGEKGGKTASPTISAVGYNTVLTGVWANKHNVWDNNINAPNYSYPTIFKLYKDLHPEARIGIFSSWLDNRTKLCGEASGILRFDEHIDGLELDTLQFPHDKEKRYMKRIDSAVTDAAAHAIRNHPPDISWVYLEYTDDMGHAHGDREPYYQAVQHADQLIGKLKDAIEYRQQQFKEDWLIIITTDHGRDAQTGKGHGGQSDREKAGWIVTNARHLTSSFKRGSSALVDIFPSIAQFMKIKIPQNINQELEGRSFIKR